MWFGPTNREDEDSKEVGFVGHRKERGKHINIVWWRIPLWEQFDQSIPCLERYIRNKIGFDDRGMK